MWLHQSLRPADPVIARSPERGHLTWLDQRSFEHRRQKPWPVLAQAGPTPGNDGSLDGKAVVGARSSNKAVDFSATKSCLPSPHG